MRHDCMQQFVFLSYFLGQRICIVRCDLGETTQFHGPSNCVGCRYLCHSHTSIRIIRMESHESGVPTFQF